MAYRITTIQTTVADDQSLDQVDYDRNTIVWQTKDLQVFHAQVRIAPAAAEAPIAIAPVAVGYFIDIRSDYPVLVRLNGPSNTQFTLHTNNTSPTNLGAPLPDQCVFVMSGAVTSVYIAPITGATQTANVRICVTGDPISSYI